MKLVFGLGNPGERYRFTWHNLGYLVVEEAAHRLSADWRSGRGEYLEAVIAPYGEKVVLIKPLTFMNLSGLAWSQATRFFRVEVEDTLVVYDDISLPLGTIRLRPEGSAGGHNGIAHIISQAGTPEVPRLRVGFDRGVREGVLSQEVLNMIPRSEADQVSEQVDIAVDAVHSWLENGMTETMNQYNSRKG